MFTIRTMGGVALFLFGTTFLWLTPEFATRGISTSGVWWSTTRVLSLLTVLVFTVATWGLFLHVSWWAPLAVAAAVLGLVALVPYWLAAQPAGEPGRWMNAFVHVLGSAGVLVLLLVPGLQRWVDERVMPASRTNPRRQRCPC